MSLRLSPLFLGAGILLAAAPRADAFDLTGTYTGKYACKGVVTNDQSGKNSYTSDATLRVTQTGAAIGLFIDFTGSTYQYSGAAVPDVKKPEAKGEMPIVLCGTNDVLAGGEYDELGRLKVSAKPGALAAKITGTSVYSDLVAGAYTCKWSFKRTDLTNPAVAISCP
ncbi:MAG: hypothetical protein HY271_14710 [Deltaproteobacteria bacterium]|nr:hypothetical protein [Deltaproteobacteria bacterium]